MTFQQIKAEEDQLELQAQVDPIGYLVGGERRYSDLDSNLRQMVASLPSMIRLDQ